MHRSLAATAICLAALAVRPTSGADAASGLVVGDVDAGEAARTIDRLIEEALARDGVAPLALADDAQYVRRAYLDVIGRIPTLDETKAFLESKDPQRRERLVDELLDSRGYVSHQYNYWADVLRVKDEDAGISRAFYVNWLKESIATNKAYDTMVRELLVATGSGWQRGNGAVGYYFRDRGMPLDNMANTVRIFLGTRMACAQCHDHPNDRWTRREFFQMAAFTDGLTTDNTNELFSGIYQREKETTDEDLRAFSQYIRNTYHRDRVLGPCDGTIPLPEDYQYDDGRPKEAVSAEPIFASQSADSNHESGDDSRKRFAGWLTSRDNPRFTEVIANRLWKGVMGRGLVEPVDEFKDDTRASHPELLEHLTRLMKDLDYDMKAFQRILLLTQTYQRASDADEPADGAPYSFRGRLLRRMTAEQTWDSLVTLAVANVDERESGFYTTDIHYRGRPVLVGRTDMYTRFDEVKDHTVDEHWEYLRKELQAMREDLKRQGAELSMDPKDLGRGFYRRPKSKGLLVRASELRSPEVPGHFLRIFGQSNREFIEAGSTAANVPQFLSMFNGFIESEILADPQSELMRHVARERSTHAKIDTAFLSVLSRLPTEGERAKMVQIARDDPGRWCQDMLWALLNTHEFIFIR